MQARVTGFLVKVAFQDGAEVKEGEVLFEIDPRLYRAELDREEAAVGVAEARLKVPESNHKRATALLAQNAISQEECDKAAAERDVAAAGVRLAKAQLAIAQLNLERTRVVAPVSGRIGRRLVDPGNLVKADETNLASLVTHDPMFVYFDVDERVLLRMQRSMREGKLKTEKLPAAVGLVDENGFPHRGVVDFMDNCVDPKTASLRLRAVLPNKEKLLTPGLFARVRLLLGDPHKVLLVPEQAVMVDQEVRFVYIVNEKNMIEKRPVVLGQTHDSLQAVKEGLKAEDRVIVGRLQRLRPGMVVRPQVGTEEDKEPKKQ